jgi:hypothetical protein
MRARYLDPFLGRFTTRDPIDTWGDEGNLGNGYTFVGNDPVNSTDPLGTSDISFCKSECDLFFWGLTNKSKERKAACYATCDQIGASEAATLKGQCEKCVADCDDARTRKDVGTTVFWVLLGVPSAWVMCVPFTLEISKLAAGEMNDTEAKYEQCLQACPMKGVCK